MRCSFVCTALLSGGLAAQTLSYAPSGHDVAEGSVSNTIPFWAASSTYQQVHDASDLTVAFGAPTVTISSINLRRDGLWTGGLTARGLDVQISLGQTTISAATATTDFATNLGPTPSVVLPYTNFNLPALTAAGVPNPVGWSFPFATPFTYVAPAGNLCWEMRIRNASSTASATLDAASLTGATLWPLFGNGCIATGQTQAATIGLRSFTLTTGAFRHRLDRGAANAPAVLLFGTARQQFTVPGLCSNVETLPVVDLAGVTGATGTWDVQLNFGPVVGWPSTRLVLQFAFLDASLGLGLGLSPASEVTTPQPSAGNVSRIYAAPAGGGAGNELATTGTLGLSYGLVTIFGS